MPTAPRNLLLAASLCATAFLGCNPGSQSSDDCDDGLCDDKVSLDLCVGIRGNGEKITAHFGALARIVENYGKIDGSAGGAGGTGCGADRAVV